MKIGTFNLRNLFGPGTHSFHFYKDSFTYTPEFVQKRIDYLSEVVKKLNADLLFVQEVGSQELLEKVAKQSGINYSVFVGNPNWRGIANGVLYQGQCSCSSVPPFGPLPEFTEGDEEPYANRSYHHTDFIHLKTTYKNAPLDILDVHLKSSGGVKKENKNKEKLPILNQLDAADGLIRAFILKLSQAKKLRQILSSIFDSAGENTQIITLGDFNAQEDSEIIRIIKGDLTNSPGELVNVCDLIPEERFFFAY